MPIAKFWRRKFGLFDSWLANESWTCLTPSCAVSSRAMSSQNEGSCLAYNLSSRLFVLAETGVGGTTDALAAIGLTSRCLPWRLSACASTIWMDRFHFRYDSPLWAKILSIWWQRDADAEEESPLAPLSVTPAMFTALIKRAANTPLVSADIVRRGRKSGTEEDWGTCLFTTRDFWLDKAEPVGLWINMAAELSMTGPSVYTPSVLIHHMS